MCSRHGFVYNGQNPREVKNVKKLITVVTALAMIFALAACGAQDAQPTADGNTRVITDSLGREVSVPAEVDAIVVLGNTPRMATYLGLADRVVGYSGMDADSITPLTAYANVTKDDWADLPVVGTDSQGNTSYNSEEIILTGADVIFCTATSDVADQLARETGIPVVAVSQGTLFGEDFEQSLAIIADACGVSERAQAISDYVDECFAELERLTADIPEDERHTVLSAAATFRGVHGIEGIRVYDPVMLSVNALNLADESDGGGEYASYTVDKEQIVVWNPEYIFMDSGGVPLVRQDCAEHPAYYAELAAFQNGRMYQYPSSTSYYDNMEISLANCYYVGSVLYPERFADVDFEAKASEIFDFFLGEPDYLSELEAYGAFYGAVDVSADA